MKTEDIERILKEKGFQGEKLDSGYSHTIENGPIKLICYVEPGMEVEFVSIYSWNDNDVKGTYNIPINKLLGYNGTLADLFRKTKNNLPQRIGVSIDTHVELEKAIETIFG